MERIPTEALLDSGADQSMISQKLWKRVELQHRQALESSGDGIKIRCIHGSASFYPVYPVKIKGLGLKRKIVVAVVPRLPHALVLGRDWPQFRRGLAEELQSKTSKTAALAKPGSRERELAASPRLEKVSDTQKDKDRTGMVSTRASSQPVEEEIDPGEDPLPGTSFHKDLITPSKGTQRKGKAEKRREKQTRARNRVELRAGQELPWVPAELMERFPSFPKEQQTYPTLARALEYAREGSETLPRFLLEENVFYHESIDPRTGDTRKQLVIPTPFRHLVLRLAHDHLVG